MITVYAHTRAPNPLKVLIILEELGLKYEVKYLEFGPDQDGKPGIKGVDHLKLNPNGRVPTIVDHDNGDFVLWESASIVKYLLAKYDAENKISFPAGTSESFLLDQWITFQVSGQGPYYGQATWFKGFHPEKLPSAIERYQKESIRVLTVLDTSLSNNNSKYLVGDKLTAADIIFFPWNNLIFTFPKFLGEEGEPLMEEVRKLTSFLEWHESVGSLESVKKVYETRAGLNPPNLVS